MSLFNYFVSGRGNGNEGHHSGNGTTEQCPPVGRRRRRQQRNEVRFEEGGNHTNEEHPRRNNENEQEEGQQGVNRQEEQTPGSDGNDYSWEDIPLSMAFTVHEHGRKTTGIVKDQMEQIMASKEKRAAEKRFGDGGFWTNPKKVSRGDVHKCWPDFFQMRVFNWFPDSRMPAGWKLKCPNCGEYCKKNGQGNKPRLIYGTFENYILNAPQRYLCRACQAVSKEEEARGIHAKDRTQYSFLSTDAEVLVQIEEENPSLILEFPCTLSAINGIDNELMEVIIFNASKSVGPSATADMLLSFHEKRWNQKEVKWLSHVKHRIKQPSPFDRRYDRNAVEKCPSYFSEEMCGCVPSSKYLVLMFNRYITARRRMYDSEVLKCCLRTSIISLDASYKVGKYMMKHGKEKMYDTLHSVYNEYGQIVGQKFSNGDSHEEIEANLKELHSLGLNPEIAFSDNPERDRAMLQRVFPKLHEDINEDAFKNARVEAASSGNPILPVRGKYIYLWKARSAQIALQLFMEKLTDAPDTEENLVSIDAGKSLQVCIFLYYEYVIDYGMSNIFSFRMACSYYNWIA